MTKIKGPFPIVCRAHSGGRILSEIYIQNEIQMGIINKVTKDTGSFAVRNNFAIKKNICHSQNYISGSSKIRKHMQNLMSTCLERYIKNEIKDISKPFGWKFGETLFTLPVVFDLYPGARAIHLIRDGRDVMLSRIEARFDPRKFHEKFNRIIVLGDKQSRHFKGEIINSEVIGKYRTELEFIHWNTVIEYGKKLRSYNNQYLEIRYEDLCISPKETLDKIFHFLKVPLLEKTVEWAKVNVSADRIGKWKKFKPSHIHQFIGGRDENLTDLGYEF